MGLGCVSAIGNTVTENFNSLQKSISGIASLTLFESIHKNNLLVGEVKLSSNELAANTGLSKNNSRTTLLGALAAKEALAHANLKKIWRTGLISATTVGGMDRTENFMEDFLQDETSGDLNEVRHHECGSSTEQIAELLGVRDFISTINTACSSSVNSIMLAARLIKQDKLDVVVAGGTDALTKFTLNGFNTLMILDKNHCRPFDSNRQGLNLGEGAGYVVLVSDRIMKEEQLKSLALVSGYANTNDAFHQTASSPEGRGSYQAMTEALAMANLQPSDINYINLHGTGTLNNDGSEGTAVQRLFGDNVPAASSTKAYTGHTLGASGGVEAIYSILALQHKCVFPNLRFETKIPELNFTPQKEFQQGLSINHVLSNSFGFGGNCSSIIFSAIR